MKTKALSILLLAFCLYMCTPERIQTQSVTVDGKLLEVASRSTLTAKTDYFLLKEKSDTPARAYLKTNKGFTTTVFSEAELQTFLATKELSVLGNVSDASLQNNRHIQYVTKGKTNVLVIKRANRIDFLEYTGPISDLIGVSQTNPQQTYRDDKPATSPENNACRDRCWERFVDDLECSIGDCTYENLVNCINGCFSKFPRTLPKTYSIGL